MAKVPEKGAENMEGREASAETPAAAAQAGVPLTPGGGQDVKMWTEFVEEEKTRYTISSFEKEGIIFKLRLVKTRYPIYPYMNHVSTVYEVSWDGTDWVEVERKVIRDSWCGTGTEHIATVRIEEVIPETPWYFDLGELEEKVKRFGVREVMEMIVEELAERAFSAIGD